MCGIVAVLTHFDEQIDVYEATEMLETLKHRGPDDTRVMTAFEKSLFLGFNRLAIVDESELSMQPITDNSKRFTMIFNGEIYNYLELKLELVSLGYKFESSGDGEVLINAYHAWGEASFSKFNGMWAVVIYDSVERELIICRDRFGVKPIYFSKIKNRFYIASELKAFSKVRGVTFETDPLEITFGHLFPSALPNTILSKVSKILPGQLMRVRQESLDVSYKRWWILQDEIMHSLDNTRVRIDSLDSILESAVELRMRSDVPLAFSLSSGVDSTLLISQAAKMGYSAITAFSQGTSDLQDESVLASKTARALGIELKVTNLENYFSLELLLQSIYALEGSQSLGVGVLAHYKEIYNSGFKVVIEGHGGDELFGGYESHYRRIALHKILRLRPGAWLKARKMASALNGNQDSSITFIFRHHLLEDLIESLTNELNKARNSERIRKEIDYRLRSFGLDSKYNPLSYGALQRKIGFENYLLLQDFSYSTLPKILENFDKLSMSQSLEVRSPFLDWRFVLASFLIPGNEKFLNGGSKQILRDLMQPRVPIEVRNNRRKLGFTGHPTWLLTSQVQELILDYSRSRTFLDSPYWKGQEISSNIETSLKQGKGVEIMKYWGKIQLAIFMEAFAGEKF